MQNKSAGHDRAGESDTQERPDMVLVYGDVNSTSAASLVCSKQTDSDIPAIPIAHIEAGLRSFDRNMPEEINRIVTDALSDFLFVTEPSGVRNLQRKAYRIRRYSSQAIQ